MSTGYWEMLNLRAVITLLVPSLILCLGHRAYSHYSNHSPSSSSSSSSASSSAPRERLEKLSVELNYEAITPQTYFARDQEYWLYYPAKDRPVVTGWPSQGGVYKLDVYSRLELEFLGLDLFNNTLRPSISDPEWQNKENAHCDRMRLLGPTWWESDRAYNYHLLTESWGSPDGTWNIRKNKYIRVGWPTGGGVWVWQPTDEAEAWKKGGAKLQNANTMEERCDLIKSMGGVFYADPQDCPYLELP